MNKEHKDLLVFGYGLAVIAFIFCVGSVMKHGLGLAQLVFGLCALTFAGITAFQWQALRPGYKGWMKVAHMIGTVVTTVLLSVVFFAVFTPVGILLRLLGKDHLDRKIDRAAASYWHARPKGLFSKERYTEQF